MMRFAEERADISAFTFPSTDAARPQELAMARALVETLASARAPAKYTDDYREDLMKVIRAKMKGRAPKLAMAEEPQSAEVVDLMERLRRSLEGAQGGRRKP